MKHIKIINWRMFVLMLAFLFAVQYIGFSLIANAQEKTTQRTETVDESTLRPNAEDIKNALPMKEAIREKEARQLKEEITPPQSTEDAAPSNDMFSNGQIITGSSGSVAGTNIEATLEPGEPQGSPLNKTVWYRWTAPANLSMTFETQAGSLTDTVMGVYTGSNVSSLIEVTRNDDINGELNRLSRVTFIANAATTYNIQVRGWTSLEGTFTLRWGINGAESWKQFNFDGNTGSIASDFAVWRPSTGVWWIFQGISGTIRAQAWGLSSDLLVPGDYDGDGGTDIAIWRPSTGTFWVLRSLDGTVQALNFGMTGDQPVQGDFDGDDKADFTVWRPWTGTFWIFQSSTGSVRTVNWGIASDYLACGDYDGDGKTDFGIQRNIGGSGVFYILRSSDFAWDVRQFGLSTDYIVPGDYDGDGKNDTAVYRYTNNTFYYLRSSDGGFRAVQWGISGDVLAPGDYIGADATDICIWRPSDGNFYCLGDGGTGAFYLFHFGLNGDYPVARSNVH